MKKLLAAILGFAAVLSAHAAAPRGVPVEKNVLAVAQTLLAKLPGLAADGMCEAEREENGWNFMFRVQADKSSSQEVQVIVRATSATQSEVRVQGVRIESAWITAKRMADPELSKQWSERILKLVDQT